MHRNADTIMQHRTPVRAATKQELEVLTNRRQEICTEMMDDYRLNNISKSRVELSSSSVEAFDLQEFEKDTQQLYDEFVKDGYFIPTTFWLINKTALVLTFLSLSILSMKYFASSTILSYILPGMFLGLFWHQSGFLMHDAEHHNLVGSERMNDVLGWMYGTVFLGVNGAWWREEHREHHALLNTYDEHGVKDPQVSLYYAFYTDALF